MKAQQNAISLLIPQLKATPVSFGRQSPPKMSLMWSTSLLFEEAKQGMPSAASSLRQRKALQAKKRLQACLLTRIVAGTDLMSTTTCTQATGCSVCEETV